ncbi:hypothetical protein L917_02169 [Phytophthora nicotianae]|uniref:DHHA2 domain-containing protein n=1 Tax=Phytophthora nicotianae TaxID=4792 RepID=W2LV04_PHYNI|nr:hypothetical protein L917_02169 [Phytophthora nicotianae]
MYTLRASSHSSQRLLHRRLHLRAMSAPALWRADSSAARGSGVALFNEFLRSTRAALTQSPASVHIFMGNEAADADSIVSSLSYAFLHSQQHSDTLSVPVLPILRKELALRCDVSAFFEGLGVDTNALVFVDEFPWEITGESRVEVTLMDHNALNNKKIPHINDLQVVEIVDHHSDLGQHLNAKREVAFADGNALVASTCTLVAEKLKEMESHEVHKLLSTMLLGVIALDSINFDPSAKKVTPRDIKAAEKLEETAFAKKETLFRWLQAEKFNPAHWGKFKLENCLQVDYKEFTFATASEDKKVGISSVLLDLEAFVLKTKDAAELRKELSEYCKQNELSFLVVMTVFMTQDKQRHRQLLFFQEIGNEAKCCIKFIEKEGSLQMQPLMLPEAHRDDHVAAFNQRNIGASRKQVAPLLQRALAENLP